MARNRKKGYEPKDVLCPLCGEMVFRYDGRGTMPLRGTCRKCGLLVRYYPAGDRTALKPRPERAESSGMIFY